MDDLKKQLINIENDFSKHKAKIEKFHKLFVALYFTPLVAAVLVYIYSQFNNTFAFMSSLAVKIILFSLFAIGMIIHFTLRYLYHRSNKGYRKFINKKLDEIRYNNYTDEEIFNKDIIETAKNIFQENGWEFSNVSIKNSPFWHLVFIKIGIEFDDY